MEKDIYDYRVLFSINKGEFIDSNILKCLILEDKNKATNFELNIDKDEYKKYLNYCGIYSYKNIFGINIYKYYNTKTDSYLKINENKIKSLDLKIVYELANDLPVDVILNNLSIKYLSEYMNLQQKEV